MSSVVECLLVLRDSVDPKLGGNIPPDVTRTPSRKQWGVPEMDKPQVPGAALGKRSPAEDKRNGVADPKAHQKTPVFSGRFISHTSFQESSRNEIFRFRLHLR